MFFSKWVSIGFHLCFHFLRGPTTYRRFGAQIGVYIAALVYYCGEILQAPVIPLGQVGR